LTETKKLHCKKCNWEWVPRKADVRQCPHCKTAYWNVDKEKEIQPRKGEVK